MGGNYTPGGAVMRHQCVKHVIQNGGKQMTSVRSRVLLSAAVVALLAVAAGCGGGSSNNTGGTGGNAGDTVSASTCGKPVHSGEFTIVSDFPLQGSSSHQTTQMNQAIQLVLEQHGWKAGSHTLQFQACDDSTAQLGSWDSATCSSNANSYSQTQSLIGVIGTFNSGCAELEVPLLNGAPNGPVAMVSPANTWPGLTQKTSSDPSEPDKYYPNGTRNYARVIPADNFQGPALAQLAKELGVKSVYIINDKQAYGAGVAGYFEHAATKLGIKVLGNEGYNTKTGTNYQAQFQKIQATKPDAIMVGGLICENGGQLIKDKVAVLGPNSQVKLLLPDGFTTQSTIDDAGAAAEGAYMSVGGVPVEQLSGAGATFIKDFQTKYSPDAIDPYTPYAAAATEVLLKAIEASDGTRPDVAAKLFGLKLTGTVLGDFSIDTNGDTDQGSMTINIAKGGKLQTFKVIQPDASLVETL
jgi:branched-chain amino acid transport system substrate-binding protein